MAAGAARSRSSTATTALHGGTVVPDRRARSSTSSATARRAELLRGRRPRLRRLEHDARRLPRATTAAPTPTTTAPTSRPATPSAAQHARRRRTACAARVEPLDQRRLRRTRATRARRRSPSPSASRAPAGAGGVTFDIATARRHRDRRRRRLHREVADRPDDPGRQLDLHVQRARQRRHRRRAGRDVLRQRHERHRRDRHRRPGPGHDRQRRRDCLRRAVHADPRRSRAAARAPRSPAPSRPQGVVVGDFEGTAASSGFYLQDADRRRRRRDLRRHLRLHRQREHSSTSGDRRPRHRLRPRALQPDDDQRLEQRHAAVPAANIVDCGTGIGRARPT